MNMLDEAHLGSIGDICFVNGKLVSVAEDSILKVFNINKSKLTLVKTIEVPNCEPHSISSNGIDKIILGGSKKTVDVHSFSGEINTETFENPALAMKFQSEVSKVRFNGTKWVVGISNDSHLSLFNTETQQTIMCKPGHEGCSVKSG